MNRQAEAAIAEIMDEWRNGPAGDIAGVRIRDIEIIRRLFAEPDPLVVELEALASNWQSPIWTDAINARGRELAELIAKHKGDADTCNAVGPHHGDRCKGGRVQAHNAQFTQWCEVCNGTGKRKGGAT